MVAEPVKQVGSRFASGVATFVADSALGPTILATAIAAWLVMPVN